MPYALRFTLYSRSLLNRFRRFLCVGSARSPSHRIASRGAYPRVQLLTLLEALDELLTHFILRVDRLLTHLEDTAELDHLNHCICRVYV